MNSNSMSHINQRACSPRGIAFAFLCFCSIQSHAADSVKSPRTPSVQLSSFHFADPSLEIELVASEPQVVSPVSIAWDEHGHLFVAEMSDYPAGPGTGSIKRLEDKDGDGVYESATLFASKLPFPNSVLPWRNGVLATAAPDLWFLQDANGDGIADAQEVWFTGFNTGNQQLRANGLTWGHDGWIYGANGRSDGNVRRAQSTNTFSLVGHDFRFHPITQTIEPVPGRSQFGLARDDWGNRFLSWNTIPIRHEVIAARYLERNAWIGGGFEVVDLIPADDSRQVYPLTAPPLTFNRESTAHFNALGGLTLYRGNALPSSYYGNAFVGETLRNLVHRRTLTPKGSSFTAERNEAHTEFLASDDPWFHPVNFATGPDGCLYVVDFYREWVEHPAFVPEHLRKEASWQSGSNHGRIWRIRSKGSRPQPQWFNSNTDIVAMLDHPNAWQRDTAQRLLLDGSKPPAPYVVPLEQLRRNSKQPATRLLATRTLYAMKSLKENILTDALRDSDPRVVVDALRIAETFWSPSNSAVAIRHFEPLVAASDPRVQLQLALTLGTFPWPDREKLWHRLTQNPQMDESLGNALGTSAPDPEHLRAGIGDLAFHPPGWWSHPGKGHSLFLRDLGTAMQRLDPRVQEDFLGMLVLRRAGQDEGFPSALLLVSSLLTHNPKANELLKSIQSDPAFSRFSTKVKSLLVDPSAPPELRLATRAFISTLTVDSAFADQLFQRVASGEPGDLPIQMTGMLLRWDATGSVSRILAHWPEFSPRVRPFLISMMTLKPETTWMLAAALTNGVVPVAELSLQSRLNLPRNPDAQIAQVFQRILGPGTSSDRKAVIDAFQPCLQLQGRAAQGARIFAQTCLGCHTLGSYGNRVGPDLGGLISRPKKDLLVDILDPSRQVTQDYRAYELTPIEGDSIQGILVSETQDSIILRRPNMADQTLPRNQVRGLKALSQSLMPEGLESGLSHQAMADLLEFLHRPAMDQLSQ